MPDQKPNPEEKRETLDDLFEEVAAEQAKRADALDSDAAYQARLEALRAAQVEREIKAGIRDEHGDWIIDEDADADETGEEE